MPTVREATFDLLRRHGMTTIFGNPGSTELPMLRDLPPDFRYVLALQELVAVGMADGFAQASRRPAHVNLHTAPGVGNAVGGIFNAQVNKSPLLITAGQQVRAQVTMNANLTNREAVEGPKPYVKWSYEPPRPVDVPAAIAQAIHRCALPPKGPAFVSVPMDDWDAEVPEADIAWVTRRSVTGRAGADPFVVADLARALNEAASPLLVAGPDVDASGAWDAVIALAERQRLPVWATPAPGGGRLGFPEGHAHFRGILPPAIGPVGQTLEGHDLVLVLGSSVFPYYPYIPGPPLPDGTRLVQVTSDPDEAARAPMGDAIVADVALTAAALLEAAGEAPAGRPALEALPRAGAPEDGDPLDPGSVHGVLAELLGDDGIVVLESPSSTMALRNRLRLSRPGSYYFGASGGLGFGLAAAIGVQLAQPARKVVCVLGEGSAQYAITGLWTAAAYRVPVTFLVMRNDEYAILKWFSSLEGIDPDRPAPGLDLPALDTAAVAQAYGVPSVSVHGLDQLRHELGAAVAKDDGPSLVEVAVAPGMAVF